MNTNIQYIDIQNGGMQGIFNAAQNLASSVSQVAEARSNDLYYVTYCKIKLIVDYLNILSDKDSVNKVTESEIKSLYDFFVYKYDVADINEYIKKINDCLTNLEQVNRHINPVYTLVLLTNEKNKDPNQYNILCDLYKAYYVHISKHQLTDEYINLLCEMNVEENYIIVKQKTGYSDSSNLEEKYDFNLDESLEKILKRYRLGIRDSDITDFLSKFELYINYLLNPTLIDPENYNIDLLVLVSIAKAFKTEKYNVKYDETLITDYINTINDYIKIIAKSYSLDNNEQTNKTDLKDIFVSNTDSSLIDKYFQRIEIDSTLSGPNKFFILFNEANTDKDFLKTSIKFYKYVNVFRTEAISEIETYTQIKKLNNSINDTKSDQINEYVLYNKSLNKWVNKRQSKSQVTINYENLIYSELYKLLNLIPDEYLDFGKMSKTINKDISLNFLKTNQAISLNLIDPSLLNLCVISEIKDKTLSGIKIFLYMYKCAQKKLDEQEINKIIQPIHTYLNLNTNEKKSHKLVKESKLKTILKKLIDSEVTLSDAKTLQKIYLKKKIRNSILETKINELVNLTSNPAEIAKIGKYVYNLLIALSPESIDWNLLNFITGYFQSKFAVGSALTGIKQYFGSKDTIFSIKDFEQYVIDQQTKKVPKWDLDTFKIYSYFNFDALIVNRETLEKILDELKSNEGISEKQFKTLTKIFNAHKESLKLVNKEPSSKLDYFVEKMDLFSYVGNKKLGVNKVLSNRLYKILLEVSNQNIYTLNIVDFLKEQGITTFTEDNKIDITNLIVDMFEIYEFKDFKERNKDEQEQENTDLGVILNKMSEGMLDDTDKAKLTKLIKQIQASPEYISKYISQAESIKIFFAKLTDKSQSENQAQEIIDNYDLQQELYQILVDLAKTSTVITETTNIITEQVQDAITQAVNTKIQALKLQMGFKSVAEDEVKQVGEIISTAKTIAVTAGTAFATLGAYKAVDVIFGATSDSGSSNSSLISYENESLKSKIQALVIGVGTTLTLSSAKTLYPKILDIVKSYIGLQSDKSGLPIPDLNYPVLGGIIMGGLTLGIQGQLGNNFSGGSQTTLTDKPKSKSLIELILDWIFNSIDKLFGFNGVKPEIPPSLDPKNIDKGSQINRIESTYLYLTSQSLGSDDIFDDAIINEHPDQQKVLQDLTRRYNEFNSLNFEFNPYFTLKKQDKKKIKKIIAKIVALELNLFKASNPYTFVYALNKFLSTEKNL